MAYVSFGLLRVTQIEQHDYEQEENHDRPGIDNNLYRCQELRSQHDIETGQAEEYQHQVENTGYRILTRNDHQRTE